MDPLNYHPIFPATMSGRRFEQILRYLNCADDENKEDNLYKVSWLVKSIIKSSQNMFSPPEALSLDESLLLFRGRLRFRVYIKNKKSKYGIKFYELCSNDGYVLNIEIYKVIGNPIAKENSQHRDIRSNRKGNPKEVTGAKLKSGQHIWRRKGNVQKDNKTFKEFRNDLIKSLLGISPDQRDGRVFVNLMKKTKSLPSKKSRENLGHVLEAIPVPENKKGKKKRFTNSVNSAT
ncbi:unnamed protein product [Acanthoscelides obtectus]|uniref:PiggyBac transposable element-derived protein domain-containing protein n=1 Tax=Acanthoscelides obtectus TaxID=200917 RepID=A0A9P0LC08_ACAOB|nr:unnamed protein product [Acanthoscelides obtectus]CAK1620459.1 PiggyBac transposable element-derived protein 4 [Acanthoscelides obtectus]